MGLTRFNYLRSMPFQSTTKFLLSSRWILGSLLFIADKFRDLSQQESKSSKLIGSGTSHLPPTLAWVSLVNEAQLKNGSSVLGEADSDPWGDKANHNQVGFPTTTDPIYQSPAKSNSEGGKEVYMVGQGEQPNEKTTEEIAREAMEEIARAARLTKEADKGKWHNGLQDDSGSSDDEPRDDAPS
jgi:hypothetical protein